MNELRETEKQTFSGSTAREMYMRIYIPHVETTIRACTH